MLHAKLDCWILSLSCRNTRPRENTMEPRPPRWEPAVRTRCYRLLLCCHFDCLFYPTTTALDTLLFPATAQEIFPCPITPWDSAESIYMIPTMGSSPSFFPRSLTIQLSPWPETYFTCLQRGCSQTLLPSDHHPK